MSRLFDELFGGKEGASIEAFLHEAKDADTSAGSGNQTGAFEECQAEHVEDDVERAMILSSLRG
jgi:hypothetical protein